MLLQKKCGEDYASVYTRQIDIDILRGIGILSVIWYHMGLQDFISQYFSSFHMMLFFFVSGYCYRKGALISNQKMYVLKKMKGLLRPYFIWSAVYTFVNILLDWNKDSLCIQKYFKSMFVSNLSLWFLLALFICTLVSAFLIDIINNFNFTLTIGFIMATIGYWGNSADIVDIFRWQQAFFCVPMFIIGQKYKSRFDKENIGLEFIVILVPMLVIGIIFSLLNGMAVLSRMQLGQSIFLFYIGAICSTVSWFLISKYIGQKIKHMGRSFAFWGRYSMVVLITHQFVLAAIRISLDHIAICNDSVRFIIIFILTTIVEFILCFVYSKNKKLLKWAF